MSFNVEAAEFKPRFVSAAKPDGKTPSPNLAPTRATGSSHGQQSPQGEHGNTPDRQGRQKTMAEVISEKLKPVQSSAATGGHGVSPVELPAGATATPNLGPAATPILGPRSPAHGPRTPAVNPRTPGLIPKTPGVAPKTPPLLPRAVRPGDIIPPSAAPAGGAGETAQQDRFHGKPRRASAKGNSPSQTQETAGPKKIQYTRQEMQRVLVEVQGVLQLAAQTQPRLSFPPFHGIPQSFAKYFEVRCHVDFINWDSPLLLPPKPLPTPSGAADPTQLAPIQGSVVCATCSALDQTSCLSIADLVKRVRHQEKNAGGGFLTQGGEVVLSSLAVLLAFEHRKTSMRMKRLAEKYPQTKRLVHQFLCGEGFHIPPPPLGNDEAWGRMLRRLKFDYIRDNRTKIYTELSKNWKKGHTQFEQFVHFAYYRDAVTAWPTKAMITHSQKPILVACITGDIDAMILLAELGYFVPSDAFWDILPYFGQLDEATYFTLRHLCLYYFKKQQRGLALGAGRWVAH
jgi:hypothetical protein